MKSEWEIGYIESSYSERIRIFPPDVVGGKVIAEGLARRSKSSIFDSLFYAKKSFFMHVLKKGVFFSQCLLRYIFVHGIL